jgi:AraC-like DNA-binding protein
VHCIWFLSGKGIGAQPVVPDGRLELIVHRGDAFDEAKADGTTTRQDNVLVSGQLSRPLQLVAGDVADVVGIRFRTAGARAILANPLGELQDRVVSLADIDRRLARALAGAANQADPVVSIVRLLLEQLRLQPTDEPLMRAVTLLDRGMPVARVARDLRMSVRTLERRFTSDIGLPPKLLQQVLRFRRFHAVWPGAVNGSRAAAIAGYADHSHADREFRRFAGMTPTDYFGAQPGLAHALLSHSF